MGEKAHEFAQDNFSWKHHVDVLEKAMLNAIEGKRL